MNIALVHDKIYIKNFWEKKIDKHSNKSETEDQRMTKSALKKLRGEWSVRLENQTKHLKSFNDDLLSKAKMLQTADQT